MESPYPDHTMRQAAIWATWLAADWRGEVPIRLHAGLQGDGAPGWHPDFDHWLTASRKARKGDSKRTTLVMRKLRRTAVREYEVLYRILILGERIEQTTVWLNERAVRNDIPYPEHRPSGPHYTPKDTTALFIAGIDYARENW